MTTFNSKIASRFAAANNIRGSARNDGFAV